MPSEDKRERAVLQQDALRILLHTQAQALALGEGCELGPQHLQAAILQHRLSSERRQALIQRLGEPPQNVVSLLGPAGEQVIVLGSVRAPYSTWARFYRLFLLPWGFDNLSQFVHQAGGLSTCFEFLQRVSLASVQVSDTSLITSPPLPVVHLDDSPLEQLISLLRVTTQFRSPRNKHEYSPATKFRRLEHGRRCLVLLFQVLAPGLGTTGFAETLRVNFPPSPRLASHYRACLVPGLSSQGRLVAECSRACWRVRLSGVLRISFHGWHPFLLAGVLSYSVPVCVPPVSPFPQASLPHGHHSV